MLLIRPLALPGTTLRLRFGLLLDPSLDKDDVDSDVVAGFGESDGGKPSEDSELDDSAGDSSGVSAGLVGNNPGASSEAGGALVEECAVEFAEPGHSGGVTSRTHAKVDEHGTNPGLSRVVRSIADNDHAEEAGPSASEDGRGAGSTAAQSQ